MLPVTWTLLLVKLMSMQVAWTLLLVKLMSMLQLLLRKVMLLAFLLRV